MDAVDLFLWTKLTISVLLVAGGILALVLGYRVFSGKAGVVRDGTVVKYGKHLNVKVGTAGIGVMLTASVWAALAAYFMPKAVTKKENGDTTVASVFRPGESYLVSSGSGPTARYQECKLEAKNVVCFDVRPGAKCGPAPTFVSGLARLQVAAVPRTGPASDATAANHDRQLRQFLADRGLKEWGLHVMNYVGKENDQAVRRVVFNGVARDLEAPLCTWLACEGWTFGPCLTLPNVRDDLPTP